MVNLGEEKVEGAEYVSKSEDSMSPCSMRRRSEASDNDEESSEGEEEGGKSVRTNRMVGVDWGDELDGLGAAPEYHDDDEMFFIDELEALGGEVVDDEEENFEEVREDGGGGEEKVAKQRKEEEESEVPSVPKIGAFYMHDDRFRHRRCRGGSRLWETGRKLKEFKDERKWTHDKFEEMALQEKHKKESHAYVEARRTYEDYYQGHRKNQGRARSYLNAEQSKAQGNFGSQNLLSKTVKGRGPIKYRPSPRRTGLNLTTENEFGKPQGKTSNTDSAEVFSTRKKQHGKPLRMTSAADSAEIFSTKSKQYGKLQQMTSNTNSAGAFSQISNMKPLGMNLNVDSVRAYSHTAEVVSDSLSPGKCVSASNNSGFDMFYPASSFNQQMTQKRNIQTGRTIGYFPTSVLPNDNIFAPQSNRFLQGGWDMHQIKELNSLVPENYLTNLAFQSSLSWPTHTAHSPCLTNHMMGLSVPMLLNNKPLPSSDLVNQISPLPQHPVVQPMPLDSTIHPPLRVFAQKLSPCSASGSGASSEAHSPNSYEYGSLESLCGPSRSNIALVGQGSSTVQESGRDSLLPAGTHDQDFTATPALLPVMQFGGNHHAGLHDPALAMALSGYVPKCEAGFLNSRMTWLPVLPAAAGAVGAAYHSPYVTPDGGYYAHSTGQVSSAGVASDRVGTGTTGGEPSARTEFVSDEHGQARIKPQRYSRMNINQLPK